MPSTRLLKRVDRMAMRAAADPDPPEGAPLPSARVLGESSDRKDSRSCTRMAWKVVRLPRALFFFRTQPRGVWGATRRER